MNARRLVLLAALPALVGACARPEPRPPCAGGTPLGTACGFENPEDVAVVASRELAVVSNMRLHGMGGFLSVMPLGGAPQRAWPAPRTGGLAPVRGAGDDACDPPNLSEFAPHGLYVDERNPEETRVYAVNHGGRESIEIFRLAGDGGAPALAWIACVVLPPMTSANDVAVAPDGEIIASFYVTSPQSLRDNLKFLLGWNTGDVIAWKRERGWRHIRGTSASGANGVEVSADGRWVYYAATGGGTMNKIPREGAAAPTSVNVPGMPDNLAWSGHGTLLLASHASAWSFLSCVRTLPCRSPWMLYEVEPDTMRVTERFRHDGSLVGAAAGVQDAGGTILVSAVFGDRIGLLRDK